MINENENMSEQTVTAIAKSGSRLKAVELSNRNGTIEVTRTKSSDENVINWQDFAIKCGLSAGLVAEESSENQKFIAIGYDSAGTAFSRVSIPVVDDKEIESMVKLQAESRLPLPADQMELAWRADKARGEQLEITIAAARRQQIQNFVNKIAGFKPTNIYLDCEGIVKVWKEIFSGSEQDAVIINADARNTQICLAQKGQLINAVALDMGIDDFAEAEAGAQSENIERFVQDTRSVVDLFGIDKLHVFILSDGSDTYSDLAASLKDTGLNAIIAKPNTGKFNAKSRLDIKSIFEYRIPIGLALMLIESNGSELNLFNNVYKPFGEEKPLTWIYTPKFAGAIAAIALILFLGVSYAIDVAKPGLMQAAIQKQGKNLPALVEQQRVLTQIEKNRPDILRLISELSLNNDQTPGLTGLTARGGSPAGRGIVQLESFDYKKGKVTISGTASDNETLYKFEDQLSKKPGISGVKRAQSANRTSGRTNTSTSTRAATSTRSTSTNSGRQDNFLTRGGSTNTRGGGNNGGPGGMRGLNSDGIKFSMEFTYGTFTPANSLSAKK